MRTAYGKLIHLLMDSVAVDVTEMLEFSCVSGVKTVVQVLAAAKCLALLDDPLIHLATAEIFSQNKPRRVVQREIQKKEAALEVLSKRHSSAHFSADDVKLCCYSIGDNNRCILCGVS